MKKRILFLVTYFVISLVLSTILDSLVVKVYATNEVVVGSICAMTGPTSGTHMMCLSGSRDYLYYLNEKMGGISGKNRTKPGRCNHCPHAL